MRFLIIIFASAFILSCTRYVETNVSSYSNMNYFSGEKIIVLASNEELQRSIEFERVKKKVETNLKYKGYSITKVISDADLIAFINFGIGEGQNISSSVSMPVYGQTGISSSNTFGTINTFGNTSTYSGSTYYTPSYGITGYQNIPMNYTVYNRYFVMDIFENNNTEKVGEKMYEVNLNSTGSSGSLNCVIDEMLTSLFSTFPQEVNATLSQEFEENC